MNAAPEKTTAPVEAATNISPEFVRINDAVRMFGVGHSALYDWISKGLINSHLVRMKGKTRGVRLIDVASVREFIKSQPAK